MQAKMIPAKRITSPEGKKTTAKLDKSLEYFCPSLEDVAEHLGKDDALNVVETDEGREFTEATGLPAYAHEFSSWLMNAINSQAQVKVRGAFTIKGETADSLKLEITGTVPTNLEELLASERGGGLYMEHKSAFLALFAVWAAENVKSPKRIITALARNSMIGTPPKAWPFILGVVNEFAATLESEEPYTVYLRSIRKQLVQEDQSEDWDDLPGQ